MPYVRPQFLDSLAVLGSHQLTLKEIIAIACLEADCAKARIHLRSIYGSNSDGTIKRHRTAVIPAITDDASVSSKLR